FGRGLARSEPVIHGHTALVGHDVAGDSAADVHRRQRLLVVESVDGHGTRLVRGQSGQYLGGGVDGVDAHEGPRRVGRTPVVVTSTRIVPLQPPSTVAFDGSPRIAKSPASQSGWLRATRPSPLSEASTSSWS